MQVLKGRTIGSRGWLFRPFRAGPPFLAGTQGVALGWIETGPLARKRATRCKRIRSFQPKVTAKYPRMHNAMIKPASATPRSERKKKGLAKRRNSHARVTKTACAIAKAGGPKGPCQPKCGARKTPMTKLVARIASKTMKIHLQYRDGREVDMVNAA